MKKITVILIAVLVLCVSCITVLAETPEQKGTAISTTVPANCGITFISNGGRIEENGIAVHEKETYARQSVHTFHIIADQGKCTEKVFYGGEDITSQTENDYFTIPPLTQDMVFEVIYRDVETSDETESRIIHISDQTPIITGDTANIQAPAIILLSAASAVFVIAFVRKRRS